MKKTTRQNSFWRQKLVFDHNIQLNLPQIFSSVEKVFKVRGQRSMVLSIRVSRVGRVRVTVTVTVTVRVSRVNGKVFRIGQCAITRPCLRMRHRPSA